MNRTDRIVELGTLTFIEDIAIMVGYDIDSDDITSIDDIHNQIFGY